MPHWYVYLVRCRDNTLYCGIATAVSRRVARHNSGTGAKYIVPSRRPVICVWKRRTRSHGDALRLEYWLKRRGAAAKLLLAERRTELRRAKDGSWRLVPKTASKK